MAAWSRSATPAISASPATPASCVTVAGYDQLTAAILAVVFSTAVAAFFGVLSLRAPGSGFIMITLALGQIVWGIAYRANDLTGGDNGIRLPARPMPFGIDIRDAPSFYYFTLVVFAVALFFIWRFSRSPFGASLMGTRDQPRRMRMLGHNVWLIQLAHLRHGRILGLGRQHPLRLLQPVPQPACDLAAAIRRDPADGDPRRRQHAHRPDRRRRHHHAGQERGLDLCRALEHAARA